jgi:hypothetical protein
MPHAYTEDQLVEQPAIRLFAELGRQTVSASLLHQHNATTTPVQRKGFSGCGHFIHR